MPKPRSLIKSIQVFSRTIQIKHVNDIDIIITKSGENTIIGFTIKNFARRIIKHNFKTTITKLTYTKQVMFKSINKNNIFYNRRCTNLNVTYTDDCALGVISEGDGATFC